MASDHHSFSKVGLHHLPAELVQQIHLLALNPFFPQISRQIHSVLQSPRSHYVAIYLLSLYSHYGPEDLLVRALRHPVCDVGVAKEIKRIWDKRRGYVSPVLPPPIGLDPNEEGTRERYRSPPATPRVTAPPLRCPELPRRLFRHTPPHNQPIHPLITYIFDTYTPSPNSHKGYPLCRAVLTSNYQLISFLLDRKADPTIRDSLAVEIAISKQDLKAVKMLIERNSCVCELAKEEFDHTETSPRVAGGGRVKRRNKRPRLMDRVTISARLVEMAMKKGSREIVQYFVHEKGVMPPLDSIMKLGAEGILNTDSRKKGIRA